MIPNTYEVATPCWWSPLDTHQFLSSPKSGPGIGLIDALSRFKLPAWSHWLAQFPCSIHLLNWGSDWWALYDVLFVHVPHTAKNPFGELKCCEIQHNLTGVRVLFWAQWIFTGDDLKKIIWNICTFMPFGIRRWHETLRNTNCSRGNLLVYLFVLN